MTTIKMNDHCFRKATNRVDQPNGTRAGINSTHAISAQRGLSLIELMVALLISSLILVGLVQIFVSTRVTYQADEGLARLQENGRFAMDFLVRDIRMAGNMGCLGKIPASKQQENVWNFLIGGGGSGFDLTRGITGFETAGTSPGATYTMLAQYPPTLVTTTVPALDTTLVPTGAARGSDVVAVRFMDGNAVPLVPNASGVYHNSAQVFAGTPNTLAQGDVVMVTNCKNVAIFEITNNPTGGSPVSIAHAASGNICPVWGTGGCQGTAGTFVAGSQIAVLRSRVFFIGSGTNSVPALFRRQIPNPANAAILAEELVEGIENMQIVYGIDSNPQDDTGKDGHGADRYLTANLVTDWSRVVSVRIGLLVGTSNVTGQADTSDDTSTYSVAGVTLDPAVDDRRRRRVFTTTVGLRNQ